MYVCLYIYIVFMYLSHTLFIEVQSTGKVLPEERAQGGHELSQVVPTRLHPRHEKGRHEA